MPTKKTRPIDKVAKDSFSWLSRSYVFINKTQVKTWQGVFIIAFIAGIASALVWSISSGWHPFSEAANNVPRNECIAIPAGGEFDEPTKVVIKCGRNVVEAYYSWGEKNINLISASSTAITKYNFQTQYEAQDDQTLRIYGRSSDKGAFDKKMQRLINEKDRYLVYIDKYNEKINRLTAKGVTGWRIERLQRKLNNYENELSKVEQSISETEEDIALLNSGFDNSYNFSITSKSEQGEECSDEGGCVDGTICKTTAGNQAAKYCCKIDECASENQGPINDGNIKTHCAIEGGYDIIAYNEISICHNGEYYNPLFPKYIFKDLEIEDAYGGFSSELIGINSNDVIAGGVYGGLGGVIQDTRNTSTTYFSGYPDYQNTRFRNINNSNVVVGYTNPDGSSSNEYGLIFDNGNFEIIKNDYIDFGASNINIIDINDNGVMLVNAFDSRGDGAFYFYDGDNFTKIDSTIKVNDGTVSNIDFTAINNNNELVGSYWERGKQDGVIKKGDTFETFSFPSADNTQPYGVNDKGYIVGIYTSNNVDYGFLYDGEKYYSTNDLFEQGEYVVLSDINNNNVIVGTKYNGRGRTGFIAYPSDYGFGLTTITGNGTFHLALKYDNELGFRENDPLIKESNFFVWGNVETSTINDDTALNIFNSNQDINLSLYHSLSEIKKYDPELEKMNDDWFMKCEDGTRVKFTSYGNYLANISNPEYRQFWINRTKQAFSEQKVYNSLFIDVAPATLVYNNMPCKIQGIGNQEELNVFWKENTEQFLREIKSAFMDYNVMSNSIQITYYTRFGAEYGGFSFADIVDGVVSESWISSFNVSESQWKILMNIYLDILNKDKYISMQVKSDLSDEKALYGYASQLLINSKKLLVNAVPGDRDIYNINIGQPMLTISENVDDYYNGDIYLRKYSNGMVLVNPSAEVKSYSLEKPMNMVQLKGREVKLTQVNEVLLNPSSGAILIK